MLSPTTGLRRPAPLTLVSPAFSPHSTHNYTCASNDPANHHAGIVVVHD
jgi:hypothetical protein